MSCRQTLGVGHHREVTPVRRAERRDAVLPTRRVLGVHLGRRSGIVREANRREVLCEDLVHHLRLGEVRTAFTWRKRFSGQQEQMLGVGCQNEERGLPHAIHTPSVDPSIPSSMMAGEGSTVTVGKRDSNRPDLL